MEKFLEKSGDPVAPPLRKKKNTVAAVALSKPSSTRARRDEDAVSDDALMHSPKPSKVGSSKGILLILFNHF